MTHSPDDPSNMNTLWVLSKLRAEFDAFTRQYDKDHLHYTKEREDDHEDHKDYEKRIAALETKTNKWTGMAIAAVMFIGLLGWAIEQLKDVLVK